jgi:hypothetical protein
MKRTRLTAMLLVAAASAAALAARAWAAEEPLVVPVLAKKSAAPGESVNVGLKAARPGVVIISAKVTPADLPQFVIPLNDSGQMGDKAGDGIWSVTIPVPADAPPIMEPLNFEAQVTLDGQPRTVTVSAQVEILKGEARSVEIIAPKEGAVLSGTVEVMAKFTTLVAVDRVRVYLGAASAEMQRQGDTWKALLDTTPARNGRQRLMVLGAAGGIKSTAIGWKTDPRAIDSTVNHEGEVAVTVRNPYHYCWGDIHAHTSYSDGVQTPADAYRHARDVAKLDFFSVTDHDPLLTFDEWDDVRRQADAFDQPGKFAALWGIEWTTSDLGHICVYMLDRPRLSTDLESAYRQFDELGLVAHFNHPHPEEFGSGRYAPEGARAIAGVEVRDANEEACWNTMLKAGWRVGTDGSEDKHDTTWGDGPHWTVALAKQVSREGIIEAIRARRTYSTWDRNLRLEFTLDGEDMGADVSRAAGALPCVVNVSDPDAGESITRIDAVVDGEVAATATPNAAEYKWTTPISLKPGRHYVYVRVTQAHGAYTWSSPIWVQAH